MGVKLNNNHSNRVHRCEKNRYIDFSSIVFSILISFCLSVVAAHNIPAQIVTPAQSETLEKTPKISSKDKEYAYSRSC